MEDSQIRVLLETAYRHAMFNATDPSTQNGAIIIDDNGSPLAIGANHLPRGVVDKPERWERPGKYQFVEHAERNCIYDAARKGVATEGKIMIVPWHSCADCARGIIQAGIKLVIGHQLTNDLTPPHWKESITVAWKMLEEAKVEMKWYTGKVNLKDDIKIRFNGQIINV